MGVLKLSVVVRRSMSGKVMAIGDKEDNKEEKKKRIKKVGTTDLLQPNAACQYAKMAAKYSDMDAAIRKVSVVCVKELEIFDAGGQPFTLCPMHRGLAAEIKFYPDCDEEQLTDPELDGKFAWTVPWGVEIDKTGDWCKDQKRENWKGT